MSSSNIYPNQRRTTLNVSKHDSLTVEIIREKGKSIIGIRTSLTEEKRDELTIDDHVVPLSTCLKRYETDPDRGLTSEKAAFNFARDGPNALKPPKKKSRLAIFLEYMFGGFALLLWIGILLTLIAFFIKYINNNEVNMEQIYLVIVIFIVIVGTGLFGFYQESTNSAIMESFNKMAPKSARVIRDYKEKTLPATELVRGDIVLVQAGDCVPADIRIISSLGLKVDNSSITGEAEPQTRSPETTDMNPLETANLAFYGTNVIEGEGKGVIIATGDSTLMGHIAGLTTAVQRDTTPIKRDLQRFNRIITIIAILMGLFIFILAMISGYNFFDAFIYFIAITVANIPEGLLVTMTACLTLTAKKMCKKNCMVKKLHAIETLGSTTVICSDKTGTLTQNRMTVSHMYFDSVIMDVLSPNFVPPTSTTFTRLCRVGTLCLRAEFEPNQNDVPILDRRVRGDASESAVLKCMEIITKHTQEFRAQYPKVFEVPFNSTNKYQLSIHIQPSIKNLLLVIKGAPERILEFCDFIVENGTEVRKTEEINKKISNVLNQLGFMGERVLAFAELMLPTEFNENYKFSSDKPNYPMKGFDFIGFMSMIDPPKNGVLEAILNCKTAGIRVIMVTGDHPITAMAIAKNVCIISPENYTMYDVALKSNTSVTKLSTEEIEKCPAAVITGNDLREMDEEDLIKAIRKYEEIVFARTSPQQKLQIVDAFQKTHAIVAVTGDGVNDSPALKKADIGVSMGISGSEVSKEAADMILLDDNFASIVVGIEEGRLIYDNLKKSIAYMLTSNMPELAPFILYIMVGFPLFLTVMAVLVIDVGTDLWPGISLAYESAESDIMLRKPRNLSEKLVNSKLLCYVFLHIGLIQTFGSITCSFFILAEYGFLPHRLISIKDEWESDKNDVLDSYGQEWSKAERDLLGKKVVATYFLSIVMTQIADAIICKTRRLSLAHHGMSNWAMNYGIIFEIFLAFAVVYIPYVNDILTFAEIDLYVLLPCLPFCAWIILFDEYRRYKIRKNPEGWFAKETYF